MNDTRGTLLTSFAVILIICLAYLTRYPLIDDAFITFRYAENLRLHGEFVYNRGEHVLGTTAPLWALFLLLFRILGAPYEVSSVAIGLIATALIPIFCLRTFFTDQFQSPSYYILLTCAVVFFPLIHMTATSGMESGLYMLVTIGALSLASAERITAGKRIFFIGLLGAVAFGLRPDGILVPITICSVTFYRNPRHSVGIMLTWFAFVVPWIAWSTWYYGSPIPHSVLAKQIIHPSSPIETFLSLCTRLNRSDLDIALNCLGILGLSAAFLRSELTTSIIWLALYMLGIIFSGVDPLFYWYACPWWVWLLSIGIPSAIFTLGKQLRSNNWSEAKINSWLMSGLAVFVAIQAFTIRSYALERFENMRLYETAYRQIRNQVLPDDSLYLCETGYMGFQFPNARIIDSAGINSPEVLDLIAPADRKNREIVLTRHEKAVAVFEPTWVISLRDICTMRKIESSEWFKARYSLVSQLASPVSGGLEVFRKRS